MQSEQLLSLHQQSEHIIVMSIVTTTNGVTTITVTFVERHSKVAISEMITAKGVSLLISLPM